MPTDDEFRAAAFAWLRDEMDRSANLLDRRKLLETTLLGERLALIDSSRGIRNPRQLEATLSVMSSPDGPYDDVDDGSGLIRYAYQGGTPNRGDNIKLVNAQRLSKPIIYFTKMATNVYSAVYPVFVVGVDDAGVLLDVTGSVGAIDELGTIDSPQRRYAAAQTKRRLHQVMFRGKVLVAYARRCAICQLKEASLLEASHILGDADGGDPAVTNGLSLCRLHHGAYDRDLLGISQDAVVQIAPRLLADTDGPMLRHGLQEMHGATLTLPRRRADQPDRDHLGVRFQKFRDAR